LVGIAENKQGPLRIALLGASFDTGNLGVSALAESSIKCILHRWPDAQITLLASSRQGGEENLQIGNRSLKAKKIPVRFGKNVFLPNHFLILLVYAILLKILRSSSFKTFCCRRNSYVNELLQTDVAADITGGDSFSDIYGMRRFVLIALTKWLVILFDIPLVLLPQTYGPFNRRTSKMAAKYLLKKAAVIYSRDNSSMDYVKNLFGNHTTADKMRFVPDIAFVLDTCSPACLDTGIDLTKHNRDTVIAGLNISGLLYNGGYTRDNMFGLKTDYRHLVDRIIELLLKNEKVLVLLVPHVFPSASYKVESDPDACSEVYQRMIQKYPDRIFLTKGRYSHKEIKYVIGLCDFFIGSRMHACIAAMSQFIPTIGLAYSDKFAGVFESIGLADYVADVRISNERELTEKIRTAFEQRDKIHQHLQGIIPQTTKRILNMFNGA
jgi:colanic acid/amylovoran biosynthesis protein